MKELFKPKSVAVIGASREPGKVGYVVLKNIIESKDFRGFVEFYRLTQEMISRDEKFAGAYERMYRALEAL